MARRRRRWASSTPWIVAGGLALWIVLALLLGDLDPASGRGQWISRRWRDEIDRPWCPPCGFVEDNITDRAWVSTAVGAIQFMVLNTVVAGSWVLARGTMHGLERSRGESIDEERIRRAVEASERRRLPPPTTGSRRLASPRRAARRRSG